VTTSGRKFPCGSSTRRAKNSPGRTASLWALVTAKRMSTRGHVGQPVRGLLTTASQVRTSASAAPADQLGSRTGFRALRTLRRSRPPGATRGPDRRRSTGRAKSTARTPLAEEDGSCRRSRTGTEGAVRTHRRPWEMMSQQRKAHRGTPVNGQLAVPASGHLDVPTPCGLFSVSWWVHLLGFGPGACGGTRLR